MNLGPGQNMNYSHAETGDRPRDHYAQAHHHQSHGDLISSSSTKIQVNSEINIETRHRILRPDLVRERMHQKTGLKQSHSVNPDAFLNSHHQTSTCTRSSNHQYHGFPGQNSSSDANQSMSISKSKSRFDFFKFKKSLGSRKSKDEKRTKTVMEHGQAKKFNKKILDRTKTM